MTDFKAISGMSYTLLRRSVLNAASLPNRKIISTDFQALIRLALANKVIGTTAPPQQPTGNGTVGDTVSKATVGVYKTLGHVTTQLDKNFARPIQNFTNAARDIQRFTRDIQGVVRGASKVWSDAKNAIDQVSKAKSSIMSLFSNDAKKQKAKTQLDLLASIDNTSYFDQVRLPWTLTTVERRLRQAEDDYTIKFFVNPSKVRYSMTYLESLELVQKGHFLTSWTSPDGDNRFPALKVTFTFQSSNILADRYTKNTLKKGTDGYVDGIDSSTFYTPPGLQNFYDIMGIMNAPRTIDTSDMTSLPDDQKKLFQGQANYVILKIATRLFPLLTLEGFFQGSLDLSEDAQDPLKFEAELSFIAFNSDPPWWDNVAIQKRYEDFYRDMINKQNSSNDTSTLSILDDEIQKFANYSNIDLDILQRTGADASAIVEAADTRVLIPNQTIVKTSIDTSALTVPTPPSIPDPGIPVVTNFNKTYL